MGARRQARECALQMLYQIDISGDPPRDVFQSYFDEKRPVAEVRQFSSFLVNQAVTHRDRIDELIQAAAENWRLERMAAVDRNILRLAVAELLAEPDTPPSVVLNEAIEIAKRFSSTEAAHFINGVLDAVSKGLRQTEA